MYAIHALALTRRETSWLKHHRWVLCRCRVLTKATTGFQESVVAVYFFLHPAKAIAQKMATGQKFRCRLTIANRRACGAAAKKGMRSAGKGG